MNRQVHYIVNAFLFGLLLFIGIYFINKAGSKKLSEKKQPALANDNNPDKSAVLNNVSLSKGKSLFLSKCASCHNLLKEGTGPALFGFEQRGFWSNRAKLYAWIRNPSAFMKEDMYTQSPKTKYGSLMTAFPDLPTTK
ncbi:MAG: hypothetical protein SGI83_02990 [Bacteroidota bacterium]|nr:hypothetical protein [Bacteroidota bacterium]